ncbi:MAG: DUF192 domain-containing protein [Planctomycetes bacterium]|nr:DUF192 domain-containing protein [Planctomycetota bacterium]
MKISREGDRALIADVELADHFWGRLCGLMFRGELPPEGGLWLEPCDSIHMLFMRFPIDVVFAKRLEPRGRIEVLAIRAGVRPWVGMAFCKGSELALELPKGRAAAVGLSVGEVLYTPDVEAVAA